ncbi:MAG: hypothetical protein QOF76_692 [Solirubrobacteraceae bacterium]|nr:hypothetical protein [Solirubrobacteraceae bacterium]
MAYAGQIIENPGMHVHPHQEERFEVLEGEMAFRLGRRTIKAGPGETVVVPRGAAHEFANAGDTPARARGTVTPALDMEELFETTVASPSTATLPRPALRARRLAEGCRSG